MKKTLIIACASLAAVGVYAQGLVNFNNRDTGSVVTHIYSPQLDGSAQSGNAANDTPAGTTIYTGQLLGGLSTGATSPTDYSNGNLWTVQLYALGGSLNASASSLLPVSQYVTTMRTTGSSAAGFIAPVAPANDAGIPNSANRLATVALAVWYNGGGTITSYSDAVADGVPTGMSAAFNLSALGEPTSVIAAPNNPSAENLVGLTSFSLRTVPEPSTIALGVMGISAFLIRRRK